MFILNKVKVSNNEVSVCIINLCEPTAQIALNTWCQTVFLLFALHEITEQGESNIVTLGTQPTHLLFKHFVW